MRPIHPPLAGVEGLPGRFGTGRIIQMETGSAISFEGMIEELGARDLVFVGEIHDHPEHHLIQVQILQALTARYGPMPVAMEFFERARQPIIDRYMSGETGEDAFLEEVDWRGTWGYDYAFYRPLVLATRAGGERLLAANAPRELVRKVARKGLAALEPEERGRLPERIDLTLGAHRTYLRRIFEAHPRGDLKEFDSFYEAQCVWEETMAETVAAYLKQHGGRMAVFCGNGHIVYGFGIPDRVQARHPVGAATILLQPLTGPLTLESGVADYVWLTGDASRRSPAMPPRHP